MGRKRSGGGHRKPTRTQRRPSLTGTVRLVEHGAIVETAEGPLRITSRGLREVMQGDTVAVSLTRGPHGERRAVVESVLNRAQTVMVGTFEVAGPLGVVRPLDTRLRCDFFVLPGDASPRELGVRVGDVVAARIQSYPTRQESGVVTIERRVGDADAPDLGIACIMARYDLVDGYPAAAESEAADLTLDVAAALTDPLRRDIRDRFVLTIDPVDARDFDDAISIERTPEGGFALGVHIADVSHYVCWDSSIDLEARRRGTSVYLADRVLPMLPERLSNNLCSLVPNGDRLAMTVDMRLDAQGRLEDAAFYPSVIRSKRRLSYDEADAILTGADAAADTGADAGAAPAARSDAAAAPAADTEANDAAVRDVLVLAHELAERRIAIRRARGAVDFNTVEVHALLDEAGYPQELTTRARTAATSLIEEAMLLANEAVAAYLAADDLPAAYRVHEPPTPDHLHDAADALVELGVCDRARGAAIALGDQAAMSATLDEVAGTGAAEIANALLLRAMQRAVYRPRNEGHYALGATAYCHFTSPIRRYPDLIVHRVLKLALARTHLGARAARERAPQLVGTGREALEPLLPGICRACSAAERTADAAAHASQKVKVAQFYQRRIGSRERGVVVWMDDLGVFVRLEETQAEGLIRLRDLGDEWFDLDPRTLTATGAATGTTVRVGDAVIVEVKAVNPVRGHLDLALVHRMGAGALH